MNAFLEQFRLDPWGSHGPGAVFDGALGRDKWFFDDVAGLPRNLFRGNHTYLNRSGAEIQPLSRLAVVPKDFRGHRLICVEPKEFMFYQQGLAHTLMRLVKSHWLTRQCIDFKNQSKSREMSRNYCANSTIDLKDASDCLSLSLARLLLPKQVFSLATVARSRGVVLPDGEILENIQTLFTMGNALCFPFQSLIFWALSLATILFMKGQVVAAMSDLELMRAIRKNRVRVFGDDIIVPNVFFEDVTTSLSRCGLVINPAKCCGPVTPVRESCGSWYFYGIDCSVVRLKAHKTDDLSGWISLFESAKLLFQSGFVHASSGILSHIDSFYPVPTGFGWVPGVLNPRSENVRYNVQLQRVEVRIPLLKGARPDLLTDDVGLYSYFIGKGSQAAPRRSDVIAKRGWSAVI